MSAKVRNALTLFRPLNGVPGVELRLHRAILYNSIYRADDQLLVNQHTYGIPAAHAPVFHIMRTPGGEMAEAYLDQPGTCVGDRTASSRGHARRARAD